MILLIFFNIYIIINLLYEKAFILRPQLNWIEHLTTDQKVGGSNPFGRTNFKKFHIFIGVVHFLFAKLKICDIINLFSRSSTVWQCTTLGTQGSQVQILSSRPFKIYQGNLVFLLSKPLVPILVLFKPLLYFKIYNDNLFCINKFSK